MFRLRGDSRRIRAAEINRWNKVADQQARGELRKVDGPKILPYDPSSRVARCKNTSGADRAAFDCMAIVGMTWEMDLGGSSDLIFELDTADPDKAAAILVEPIEDGAIGKAVVDGLALAKVGGGSDMTGVPNAANHRIAPGSGTIKILSAPHATDERLLPVVLNVGGNGDNCILVKTPGGGIAAATGSGPYTWGSATCTLVDAAGTVGSGTQVVKNIVNQAIAANVVGKAERFGSIYIIDVASCG